MSKLLSHSDYWCLQAQEARLAAQRADDLETRQTCSPRRMNMTGAPPATRSGKPGCLLLGKVPTDFCIF